MKDKKISELKKKYESVYNSNIKLKSNPVKRLEEIVKFTNKFDKLMISLGFTCKVTSNHYYHDPFDFCNDFWFQYEYSKKPVINNKTIHIDLTYSLTKDYFEISSYKTIIGHNYYKTEKFNLFNYLKKFIIQTFGGKDER